MNMYEQHLFVSFNFLINCRSCVEPFRRGNQWLAVMKVVIKATRVVIECGVFSKFRRALLPIGSKLCFLESYFEL